MVEKDAPARTWPFLFVAAPPRVRRIHFSEPSCLRWPDLNFISRCSPAGNDGGRTMAETKDQEIKNIAQRLDLQTVNPDEAPGILDSANFSSLSADTQLSAVAENAAAAAAGIGRAALEEKRGGGSYVSGTGGSSGPRGGLGDDSGAFSDNQSPRSLDEVVLPPLMLPSAKQPDRQQAHFFIRVVAHIFVFAPL